MKKVAAKLLTVLRRRREYVRFWEWPDARTKERAIAEELTASLGGRGGPSLFGLRYPAQSPPDIVARDADGRDVGIEVAQLAPRETAWQHGYGQPVFRRWTAREVISTVEERIREADRKKVHGGPYAELLLLILTNEPKICYDDYAEALSEHLFAETRQLTRVYVLFSYDHADRGYRCVELKTR